MLEIKIFLPDGEVVRWQIYGSQPNMLDLTNFIKE